ncbi:MAG: glycosyltransferase family 2 protein [Chloroflexota bacterium]
MTSPNSLFNPDFKPIKIVEVELSEPIPTINTHNDAGDPVYGSAKLIVKLHTLPLRMIDLPLPTETVTAETVAEHIWEQLSTDINAHLQEDGLPTVDSLPVTGLPYSETPACIKVREQFGEDAPLVSVVICTHNRTEFIRDYFPSLLDIAYPNYELILVDNNPPDDSTRQFYDEHYADNPQVHYVLEKRGGLSWARNAGIRHSRGEIIAFTDDDARVDPHWLTELVLGFDAAENVGCTTGQVFPQELEYEVQTWFEQFGGLSAGGKDAIYGLGKYAPDSPIFPYNVGNYGGGVSMAFKRDCLYDVGGFEVRMATAGMPFGAEDIDMFVRVILAGYQIAYRPRSFLRHAHRRDYEGLQRQMYRYGVGLMAFLTHCAYTDPLWIFKIASKIPAAINHLTASDSRKNERKTDYPDELTSLERRGMLYGPIAYFKTRWQLRGATNDITPALPVGDGI